MVTCPTGLGGWPFAALSVVTFLLPLIPAASESVCFLGGGGKQWLATLLGLAVGMVAAMAFGRNHQGVFSQWIRALVVRLSKHARTALGSNNLSLSTHLSLCYSLVAGFFEQAAGP